MIVIIPEGIGALMPHPGASHSHKVRSVDPISAIAARSPLEIAISGDIPTVNSHSRPRESLSSRSEDDDFDDRFDHSHDPDPDPEPAPEPAPDHSHDDTSSPPPPGPPIREEVHFELPTFAIGFSMILGFILMFLIDRLPKHAAGNQPASLARDIRLDTLSISPSGLHNDESGPFIGIMGPSHEHSKSMATTTGLVIHAAADGIAMGASSSTSNTRLGFIIFIAIMVHKAPAAFGLTSVLLRQGLSKRAARAHLLVFSLAAPAGAIATWFLITILGGSNLEGENGQWWTGMLLLFSAGTFL